MAKIAQAKKPTTAPDQAPKSTRTRKPRKRGDGEGSLYFDAAAQLWRASLMVGKRADGRPDRRKVSARTQELCLERLDALKAEKRKGILPDKAAADTLDVFLERWLAAKAGTVRERVHTRYGQLLRKHVTPALGKTRLPALRPDALQRLYASKLAGGLAPRSVHHIHSVLHNALEDAVRWGHVGRNVTDVVEPPAVPEPQLRWPTSDELARLLGETAARNDRLHALWLLAAHTGCRLGELLALTWDDVNLDAGLLSVNRVLVKVVAQTATYGEPKTKRSRRVVPLTPAAVVALRHHHTRQAEEKLKLGGDYGTENLVFATVVGTAISHAVAMQYFKRALGWADLPSEIRIHDLRHAAATLMLGNGVDVPTVAKVLGHARNSTTLDVYGHAVPGNLVGAVAAIQRAIGG